jgi:hypothetical protein
VNKFKAAPQSHIVPALKRIASALQSESITPEEVSYRLAMVRMALSQTAQQAVEAMGPIQADSREKVMDGFSKANPALTQDQLEEIADQWEKNKDQLKTAAVRSHSQRVASTHSDVKHLRGAPYFEVQKTDEGISVSVGAPDFVWGDSADLLLTWLGRVEANLKRAKQDLSKIQAESK